MRSFLSKCNDLPGWSSMSTWNDVNIYVECLAGMICLCAALCLCGMTSISMWNVHVELDMTFLCMSHMSHMNESCPI